MADCALERVEDAVDWAASDVVEAWRRKAALDVDVVFRYRTQARDESDDIWNDRVPSELLLALPTNECTIN